MSGREAGGATGEGQTGLLVRELTPRGAGGIAVLEVRGARTLERLSAWAARPLRPGSLALVRLEDGGELVDEALIWALDAEHCELHLHGSPPLVARVCALLGAGEGPGAPLDGAPEGLEDAARRLLADAAGEAAARTLLDQAEGALRRALVALRAAPDPAPGARRLLARARLGRALVHPPRVMLMGPTNAGKSTLLNALVGHERALVHAEQGTTRDVVRGQAELDGYVYELVDTAGERVLVPGDATTAVEGAGQGLARALARTASLVVWVVPARELVAGGPAHPAGPARDGPTRDAAAQRSRPELVVASRADELSPDERRRVVREHATIQALAEPEQARRTMAVALRRALDLPESAWIPGLAVPFAEEQIGLLEDLAEGRAGALERLATVLGPAGGDRPD